MLPKRLAPPIRRLLETVRAARRDMAETTFHIAPAVYTDPERAAREVATCFRATPLILAHQSQVPQPGDVLALERLGVPLLLAHDRDGRIGAFVNVCRHRGTRLVKEEGPCRRPSFVCPYHAWTYDLDGSLRQVPCEEGFPGLDKAALGLVRLPLAVRHGLLWAVLDPRGTLDLDGHLGGLGEDFEAFGLGDHVFFCQTVQVRKTNWKLVIDAFLDGYHIKRLHRHTVGPFFLDGYAVFDVIGRHIRAAVARNEIVDAAALPEEQWNERRHVTFSYYLFPGTVLVLHPDYTSLINLFPLSSDETLYVHTMLTPHPPASGKERDHWARSFALIDGSVFQAEDLHIAEEIHRGLRAGGNERLTYGRFEHSIRAFHEILDGVTGLRSIETGA